MKPYIFSAVFVILVGFSAYVACTIENPVSNAASEIVTFISILSAAVMSCIFSVSKHISFANVENDKKGLFLINNYWVKFFFLCAICAGTTILGQILSWPSISIPELDLTWILSWLFIPAFKFDIIGFFALSSLFLIITMLFVDFPRGIKDLMLLEEELKPIEKIEVKTASLKDDPDHGKLK